MFSHICICKYIYSERKRLINCEVLVLLMCILFYYQKYMSCTLYFGNCCLECPLNYMYFRLYLANLYFSEGSLMNKSSILSFKYAVYSEGQPVQNMHCLCDNQNAKLIVVLSILHYLYTDVLGHYMSISLCHLLCKFLGLCSAGNLQ